MRPGRDGWSIFEGGTDSSLPMPCYEDNNNNDDDFCRKLENFLPQFMEFESSWNVLVTSLNAIWRSNNEGLNLFVRSASKPKTMNLKPFEGNVST